MKSNRRIVGGALCAVIVSAAAWAFQGDGAQSMPKPAPEHMALMERVGTWDAALQMSMGPGEPLKMSGVEKSTAIGDFHVISEFTSEFMGSPYTGHGVMSFDPSKKKYFCLWVDSMEPSPSVMEGTYDSNTNALTMHGENMIMGERVKMREVVTHKDADHVTFEMFHIGKDGKETKSMQIEYTRRK